MSLLSELNRVCWAPLKRVLFQVAVTCAALAVVLVVFALSGPGAADASATKPLVHHVRGQSSGQSRHHKPARGTRHKSDCTRASHCKRADTDHGHARRGPAAGRSSSEEPAGAEGSEEEEILEGELPEGEAGSAEEADGSGEAN